MKNLFLSLLTMFVLAFAGCGGSGGDSGSGGGSAPVIDTQPVSQSAVDGSSVTLSVTAHGDSLVYQWQNSTDSGATWADVSGATAASYTLTTVTASMNGWQYRVTITSGSNSVQSSAITLTVTAATAPSITVQPADVQAVAGASASFSVTAGGTSLAYQWQISTNSGATWTNVSGATAATYSLSAVTSTDSGHQFHVVVSNSLGSVTSNAALLTVTTLPVAAPNITAQPASLSVVTGQTATFTVAASGNPTPSYQWQLSTDGGATFADISGATAASYTTAATTSADNGKRFQVKVSNTQGSVTSSAAVLTVTAGAAPTISKSPTGATAYYPDNDFGAARTATFSATATGTPTPTYQWQVSTDGGSTFTNITGATSTSYTTPAVTAADNGKKFRLIASNVVGVAASSQAGLTVADAGFGGAVTALALRPTGDVLATLNGSVGCAAPYCTSVMGVRVAGSTGSVVTLAGQSYTGGDTDGLGSAASFYSPVGITLDAAGNAYVTDGGNRVRKITPAGVVTSLAGGDAAGGFVDGAGALASFRSPVGITIDDSGNIYVADYGNQAIRKVTADGHVTTLAHDTSQLKLVNSVAFNASNGLLYVGNYEFCELFTISAIGTITQIGGFAGCPNGPGTDGPLTTATFAYINSLAVDSSGNVFVNDAYGIRKISVAGQVSTLSGTNSNLGTGYSGIATDSAGNVYTVDSASLIHKITPSGTITVFP